MLLVVELETVLGLAHALVVLTEHEILEPFVVVSNVVLGFSREGLGDVVARTFGGEHLGGVRWGGPGGGGGAAMAAMAAHTVVTAATAATAAVTEAMAAMVVTGAALVVAVVAVADSEAKIQAKSRS